MSTSSNSYDQVPYPSWSFPQTHPDRLATIARLFGMTPPPIDRCRVLELGCARGGNLLPMAEELPGSTFVGVDASERQVAEAQQTARAVGLSNVEFLHCDILDLGPELGRFDYILCHGVYAWVPRAVQDHILRLARDYLTEQGVAYVSYNTYPGWHMRQMIRELMLYHVEQFSDPNQSVRQARRMLALLAKLTPKHGHAHEVLLRSELETLAGSQDAYLFHEFLEEINAPLYFHEFMERAAESGLQYLGEADLGSMFTLHLAPETAREIDAIAPDLVRREQFLDFLHNRAFRQTLLCRAGISLDRTIRTEALRELHFASRLAPQDANLAPTSSDSARFMLDSGQGIVTSDPIMKAALIELRAVWPQSLAFPELLTRSRQRLASHLPSPLAGDLAQKRSSPLAGDHLHQLPSPLVGEGPAVRGNSLSESEQEEQTLVCELLKAHLARCADMRVRPVDCVREVSPLPIARPLARWQAAISGRVTNARHVTDVLDDVNRRLVPLLDGTRDLDSLHAALLNKLQQDNVSSAQPLTDAAGVARRLEFLAGAALLIA